MSRWPMVRLGEVLQLQLDPHRVEAHEEYPMVGVYGFGRGLFARPPVSGASIRAKTLFRVKNGQFVYSAQALREPSLRRSRTAASSATSFRRSRLT